MPCTAYRKIFLRQGDEEQKLVEEIIYGEAQGDARNHRGRVFQHIDGTGILTYEYYDFKGNLVKGAEGCQRLQNHLQLE